MIIFFDLFLQLKQKALLLHHQNYNERGVEQLVARQAHNLEVACSSPASATQRKREMPVGVSLFRCIYIGSVFSSLDSGVYLAQHCK